MLGRTIGNYQVTERLGEGGMGVVYLAQHPALGRKAAIKVLHPQMAADPQVVSRFFHEARASTAIRHPNIVDTYDYGSLSDGTTYIIMELLEGESLAARLKRVVRFPVEAALDFVCQAASGLHAAHAKGIVHRDLKPDNIFVIPDPRAAGREQVKILDFGIAKLADNPDSIVSHKTRTGTLMGTPLYMSPEQCLGVREVDHRTDVYSLGCIAYEMLCGAPPFTSEGFGALINMHINLPPDTPSKHNADVPAEIDRVILKMLAKEPGQRYGGMSEVLDALFPFIAAPPSTSRPGFTPTGSPVPRGTGPSQASLSATTLSASALGKSAPAVTAPVWRRQRAAGIAAVAASAAMAVLLVVALRSASRSAPPAQRVELAAPVAPPPVALPPPAPAPPAVAAAPPPAAAPDTIEISLDSQPAGAQVAVDGAVIGTTPFVWKTAPGSRPATLTFALDGYRREVIQAVPSAGLHLAPSLKKVPTRHARNVVARTPGGSTPLDDIRPER